MELQDKATKIAFLSNFTIDSIEGDMKRACSKKGISAQIYISSYNQYSQQILDESSELYSFNPKIIFILLDIENLIGDAFLSPYSIEDHQREEIIMKRLEEIKKLIGILKERSPAKIVINSLFLPIFSSRGVIENKEQKGLRNLVRDFNNKLEELSLNDNQLFVFDFNIFCMKIGYSRLVDKRFSYLADMKISREGLEELSKEFMSYIIPLESMTKKCIVLDLDNTLWGGIVGEVGLNGINLGPDKEGKPFLDFQKKILEFFKRGVILAINSKNNFEDAIEVLRNHEYMILKENNFGCIKINWQNKAVNMKEIAKELNIGLESLIFIDDDPSNRELIKKFIPEVTVIDLPKDPALYCDALEEIKDLNLFSLTKEDMKRGEMYVSQRKREMLKSSLIDIREFIDQLGIKNTINQDPLEDSIRIAQLTQKTNQFNLTTKRYSEEEILEFINSNNFLVKSIKVEDKFGDYGLTGVAIVNKREEEWELDSFLLSCRILGKEIEFTFLNNIIEEAKKNNILRIKAKFITTIKNIPAKDFLKDAGFTLISENEGVFEYFLDLTKENLN